MWKKCFGREKTMMMDDTTPVTSTPVAVASVALVTEHRQAYGTAKTENLRDSGVWRILLPACVALGCLLLLAIPLIILIPLFVNSLDAKAATHGLTWAWVVMIVIEVGVAAIIIRGLLKIFMTQAGNY
jgi:hypothetical protein